MVVDEFLKCGWQVSQVIRNWKQCESGSGSLTWEWGSPWEILGELLVVRTTWVPRVALIVYSSKYGQHIRKCLYHVQRLSIQKVCFHDNVFLDRKLRLGVRIHEYQCSTERYSCPFITHNINTIVYIHKRFPIIN